MNPQDILRQEIIDKIETLSISREYYKENNISVRECKGATENPYFYGWSKNPENLPVIKTKPGHIGTQYIEIGEGGESNKTWYYETNSPHKKVNEVYLMPHIILTPGPIMEEAYKICHSLKLNGKFLLWKPNYAVKITT